MTASLPPAGTVVRLTRQTEWGEEVAYREVEGRLNGTVGMGGVRWTADDLTRLGWAWEPVRPPLPEWHAYVGALVLRYGSVWRRQHANWVELTSGKVATSDDLFAEPGAVKRLTTVAPVDLDVVLAVAAKAHDDEHDTAPGVCSACDSAREVTP